MPFDFQSVKEIVLEELKAKGYAPNPADVIPAVNKVLELAGKHIEAAVDEAVTKKLAELKAAPTAKVVGK